MFKNLRVKTREILETQLPGFTLGAAVATVSACAALVAIKIVFDDEEDDRYYRVTRSDFERAAREDEALRIRNDLGHFKFYCEESAV